MAKQVLASVRVNNTSYKIIFDEERKYNKFLVIQLTHIIEEYADFRSAHIVFMEKVNEELCETATNYKRYG